MDPQRWQRVRALFDAAVDLPESEWEALLRARCEDDEIRAEARALLDADRARQAATSLSGHSPDLLAALAEDQAQSAAQTLVGEHFGAWRLQRLIGQGGMGAVYLAERIEGGFQQHAALKLVRPEIGGDALANRFRTERQILARLEHANIARLLDGGVGPRGEPFLALEYVEGRDLRSHCDALCLDLRARLDLFLTVCDAVAHAHARLIVHRDLKPGNILVAADGTVKLLDFGVAKLLDPSLTGEATVARLRLYTPEYAAPEQIRGEPSTTAVDVYALGVVLFELLTGRRPFDAPGGATGALEAAVLHQDAPRPSSLITQRATGTPQQDAARRQVTPKRLRDLLRGDLDLIALRALRKQPQDRYASVQALANDLRAWIERRPVQARRGSTRYRVARFVQRHALASGFAGLALAALVGGLGLAVWQAREARMQRDLAQQEAQKAQAALDFMTGLFSRADPEATQGREVSARELLADGALRIRTELHDQPAARAELLHAMGTAHLGLGLFEDALPLLDEAQSAAPDHAKTTLARAVARHELGRYQEVLNLLEPERERLELRGDETALARVDLRLGMTYQSLNRLADADAAFARVLAYQRRALGPSHRETRETELRYVSLLVLDDRDEAAKALSESVLVALRADPRTDPILLMRALGAHAMVISNTGPLDLAESLRREQLGLCERIYGATHPRTLGARNDLASVLFGQRRYAEAAPLFAAVLDERRKQFGPDHPAVATAASNLANAHLSLRELDAALPVAQVALRVRLATYGENHQTTATSLRTVAGIELELDRPERALPLLERALAGFTASLGPDNRTLLGTLNDLVRARLALGQPDPDCALAQRALTLSQAKSAPDAPESHYQFALLGACRLMSGDPDGRRALLAAHPVLQKALGTEDRRVRFVARWLDHR